MKVCDVCGGMRYAINETAAYAGPICGCLPPNVDPYNPKWYTPTPPFPVMNENELWHQYAMSALQGILAKGTSNIYLDTAKHCGKIADAMIAEAKKKGRI